MSRYRIMMLFMTLGLLFAVGLPSYTNASGYGWGFKKNSDHQVPDIGSYQQLLDQYGAYYADLSGDRHIYLTFDNGYEEGYTSDVLDVLKENNVPATFFITGHYVETEPELVTRMAEEGHIIGNHSYHHPDFSVLTKDAMQKELEDLEKEVAELTGQKNLQYLRPPRGMFNEETLKWANDLGYTHIFWSLAFKDWETNNQKGWRYAYEQVLEQIHPGAIILLHTVSEDNAKALDHLIKDLKEQGYEFKSLDDLLWKDQIEKQVNHL